VNILSLAARLTLDGSRFKAGLKEAQSAATNFTKGIGSSVAGQLSAAFGSGALIAFAKDALVSTANLKDMAEQMHVTTDEVQRLIAAGIEYGITFRDIATSERQFNQTRKDAVESNKELRAAYERLGVPLDKLQDSSFGFTDAAEAAGAALAGMSSEDQQRALNDLSEIFGNKVGPKLREFLKGLEEAKNTPIVSKETIDRLDEAIDKAGKLLFILKGIVATSLLTGGTSAPAIAAIADMFAPRGTPTYTPEEEAMLRGETPAPLFGKTIEGTDAEKEQKKAAKEASQIAEDRLSLEKAIFKVQLDQMTATDARVAKEKQLLQQMELITAIENDGFDASKEREAAVGMLGGILSGKASALDVNSLTQQGQLGGGRNVIVSQGESAFVTEMKKALGVQTRTAVATEQLNTKIRGVTTLRSST
jgi:hypothetical protein